MMNLVLLTELGRQRRRDVARDIALCRHAASPRVAFARTLVVLGSLAVAFGTALDDEIGQKAEIPTV
jgi:hypothetical protein